ncbi:MAG: prepilin-type N-terminal cleavage/methylation domain-containing protein [Clostridiales bacterium]|nr:prepilin-type N-terminal cleavage/methylation domain-containing protein [Clostridiales bacterium]MBQ6270837.1 prepilin-type N-terminal cleavage/methylation domain-containing protein [Clostridiales bacterium]MBR4010606.1 prepilin-type N-terminal cleavage/methylation domain-containing protein [Clostridiales bacterium]MCR5057766.1 prepilin-type N-terminal cleavage/methylation domain-containing protein [Clostridiales bacterium]
MVKLHKTKKGFTLVEMVLVIAIIMIIAVVIWFTVSVYLNKAQSATESISEHNEAISDVLNAIP